MTAQQMLARALKALQLSGLQVEARLNYYEGRHPSELGTAAWNTSYRDKLSGIIDNQVRLIVDKRADAVVPVGFEPKVGEDTTQEAYALWVSDRVATEAPKLIKALRLARAACVPVPVLVDYDANGEVSFYPLDPRTAYVERDGAGAYLFGVHFWAEEDENGHTRNFATLYTPEFEPQVWVSDAPSGYLYPRASDYRPVDGAEPGPNLFGECMLVSIDFQDDLVDRLAPLNDRLNKSLQTQAVVGEAYAMPLRIYLGIETYDPNTGEIAAVIPSMNPQTGSRDVSIPTVVDAEGSERRVLEFKAQSPEVYGNEQEGLRLAMARQGSIPAHELQLGGSAIAAEALEIVYRPHIAQKSTDERMVRGDLERLSRLAIRRYLYRLTGQPLDAPEMTVLFSDVETTTKPQRVEMLERAVNAGLSLADALVEVFGTDREAADLIEANARDAAAARADLAGSVFDSGAAALGA